MLNVSQFTILCQKIIIYYKTFYNTNHLFVLKAGLITFFKTILKNYKTQFQQFSITTRTKLYLKTQILKTFFQTIPKLY